jgi:hypothetical protein
MAAWLHGSIWSMCLGTALIRTKIPRGCSYCYCIISGLTDHLHGPEAGRNIVAHDVPESSGTSSKEHARCHLLQRIH